MTIEFQFTPARKLTRRGFLRPIGRGCDEWHNPSVYLIVPLIGEIVLFRIKYHRHTPMHVHSMVGDDVHGDVVAGCSICTDLLNDMLHDHA